MLQPRSWSLQVRVAIYPPYKHHPKGWNNHHVFDMFEGVIFETSQKEREDETLPQILINSPKLGEFSKCPLFWFEFRPGILEACDKASKWLPGREIPDRSTKLEGKISIVKYTRWRIENYWLMFHKTYINPLLVNLQVSLLLVNIPHIKSIPDFP